MSPNRSGSLPYPRTRQRCIPSMLRLSSLLVLLLLGVGGSSCATADSRPAHSPAEEARHRVQFLQGEFRAGRGGAITPEQIRLIERMPYRSSGPESIPRVLREGIPEPTVPFGERRSLLKLYGGLEAGVKVHVVNTPQTREDDSFDPQQ